MTATSEDFDLTFNTMTAGAAASEKVRITSSGDIGIGTTSPNLYGTDQALTISSGSDTTANLEIQGNITGSNAAFGGLAFYNGSNLSAAIQAQRLVADNSGALTFFTADSGTPIERMVIDNEGDVGIGTYSAYNALHVVEDDASNAAVTTVVRIEHTTSGTPAAGIGTGLDFAVETAANNNKVGASITAITTDVTATSEDFDLTFNTMTAGAAANEKMRISSEGYVGIGNAAPDAALDVTGDIEYTGTITDVSDRRLKNNIAPLGKSLENIAKIDTYSFTMKDDEKGRTEFGVIAQELEKTFPELVHTANDKMGTKSVNYVGLIAPMIEATKELRAENADLKSSLDDLSQQVALLNKMAGNNVDKASMEGYLMLLLGLLGGIGIMFGFQRRKNG